MPQRHLDRLSSFDTSFLANERGGAHMAIGAVFICEGAAPELEPFLSHIRSRLHLAPRLRQRLAFPPLGLGRPLWVDDPEFEITDHVSREMLAAPGSEAQFRELIAEVFAPPLDRSRPLWELRLVEGLEGDRFGVIYKTHHAMADGISAVDIGVLLFDAEPTPAPGNPAGEPWRPHPHPSPGALLAQAIWGVGRTVRRFSRWCEGALRSPGRMARRATNRIAGLWDVTWALTKPAPKVPFNTMIGPRRLFAWASFDLGEFKAIKNLSGATINDVSLAVGAGALRRWLEAHGVSTEGLEMQALVPVSVRAEDEHSELGNRLTAMRGPLPVGVADPRERLEVIAAAMRRLKASKQPYGAEALWALNDFYADFGPPLLLAPTSKLNFSTRIFNLLLTNFPGPQIPFYVMGHELLEISPVGFLAENHALAIAIFSYHGRINFGLLADPAAIDDIELLRTGLVDSFAELLEAVAPPAPAATVGEGR
ncbi:MAG TPA: wax ester/triacylglycerol synthase family O-acyltransferase [Solirubrobacterales bacterium]|nr:wax ester/triacylglycerol synthase family O-acyltransferase [Solirubrobacterales bacterium]